MSRQAACDKFASGSRRQVAGPGQRLTPTPQEIADIYAYLQSQAQ